MTYRRPAGPDARVFALARINSRALIPSSAGGLPREAIVDHANLPDVPSARLPARYEAAKAALAECARVDECKEWADRMTALASYAKQSGDETLYKTSMRIRARASRRAGELLKQIEAAKPGPKPELRGPQPPQLSARKQAEREVGLSPDQAKNMVRAANIPEEQFEAIIESDDPPGLKALGNHGKQSRPKPEPLIDLNGRDPKEFNRSLHFVGEFENSLRWLNEQDLALILPGLIEGERADVRRLIREIDRLHDVIIARIEGGAVRSSGPRAQKPAPPSKDSKP